MEKRYYYTDALAAAWMAKHFGMKFHADGFDEPTSAPPEELATWGDEPIHIHPDSLHLLEPQLGDIVTINDPAIDYHGYCFKPDVLYRTYVDGSYGTDELSCTPPECRSRDVRIIQRHCGGLVAFHWPDCDN